MAHLVYTGNEERDIRCSMYSEGGREGGINLELMQC